MMKKNPKQITYQTWSESNKYKYWIISTTPCLKIEAQSPLIPISNYRSPITIFTPPPPFPKIFFSQQRKPLFFFSIPRSSTPIVIMNGYRHYIPSVRRTSSLPYLPCLHPAYYHRSSSPFRRQASLTLHHASIFVALSLLIATSASASLPSLLTFNAETSEKFVGEGGRVILNCHYEGMS